MLVDRIATALSPWVWVAALALLGLVPFAAFVADRSDWRWLIPAYSLWAIAVLIALIELKVLQDDWVAVFVLLVIALPFLVATLRKPKLWWPLIPAYTLAAIALMIALEDRVLRDELVASYVMFVIALAFLYVYLRNRRNWWALIPAGIMAVIGVGLLIAEGAGEYIIAFVLVVVGAWILVRGFRGGRQAEPLAPPELEAAEPGEPEGGGAPEA